MGAQPLHSKNLFSQWTKKYSLSKTLRFELKPVDETKNHLSQFIESDTQRDKDYKKLKTIIDEYHKDFIQEALSKNDIFLESDLKQLSALIKKSKNLQEFNKRGKVNKSIEKLQDKLRKQIAEHLAKAQREIGDSSKNIGQESKSKKSPLFEKELITKILPDWLAQLSWEKTQHKEGEEFKSEKDFLRWKSESEGIIKKFKNWTTYLKGFHENRKNMYSDKEQSTAIAYRIIHENWPRFLSNIEAYKKTEKFPDLRKQLKSIKTDLKEEFDYFKIKSIDELFNISFFNKCLSQTGIDNYNYIIGGKDTEGSEQKIQGVNEIINQYRQKKESAVSNKNGQNIKKRFNSKSLPLMQILYKQILSDRKSHSFYFPEEFTSREEALSAIQKFGQAIFEKKDNKAGNILEQIEALWAKKLFQSALSQVYFKSSELQSLSQKLFGDYQVISDALDSYAESSFSTKKERECWLKRDFFSFEEIHNILFGSTKEHPPAEEPGHPSSSQRAASRQTSDQKSKTPQDSAKMPDSAKKKQDQERREDHEIELSKESLLFPALFLYAEKLYESKAEKEKWLSKKLFSFGEIKTALSAYMKEQDLSSGALPKENILLFYFQSLQYSRIDPESKNGVLSFCGHSEFANGNLKSEEKQNKKSSNKTQSLFFTLGDLYKTIKNIPKQPDKDQREFSDNETKSIQDFLRSALEVLHLMKPVYLEKDKKKIEDLDKDPVFYNELDFLYKELSVILPLYNKTRNYITAHKNRLKKIKINFETHALLAGWDVNKETDDLSVILRKKENGQWIYYLGVMNRDNKKIFDYQLNFDDHEKKPAKQKKQDLRDKLLAEKNSKSCYEKMNYKQIAKVSQDIRTLIRINGQVCRKTKNLDKLKQTHFPDKIWKIENTNSYKKGESFNPKDLIQFIDYYKELTKNYWKSFNLSFKPSENYESFKHFTDDINSQGYKLSFDKIKADYIEEKVKNGELYLFKIYNKDFSQNKKKKGTPSLHTSYFKLLFEAENLKDTVFKLNGQAEIFYRKATKKRQVTHPKNKQIKNKNSLNPKKTSKFEYDIIKDKRWTEDKYFFHVPITLNFKKRDMKPTQFNQEALQFFKNNKNINIIGIDRGERHLAYYTVISQKGEILEQGSFNEITTRYKDKNNNPINLKTNYHSLLEKREKERDQSRKSWAKIENIKDLKSGYLSHLVHQISQLMIKYNAIAIFEDLNKGFKRGRMKFEKQVYQKLEKALIDKLNYLALKDKNQKELGGLLNAYQLTAPFESFQKLGKQTGFIFYTPAYYTSKVCPLTGFVNLIYPRYQSVKKSQAFFRSFDKIYFDNKAGYFVFEYKDGKVDSQKRLESNASWKVCSHGEERYKYDYKKKNHIKVNVTQKLKNLLKEINYQEGQNLIEKICERDQKDFFFQFIDLLKLILQLRHINPSAKTAKERDYILSPVADKTGRFFDSRRAKENEPKNADANGAYHIGLKGLMLLRKINDWSGEGKPKLNITNKDWFGFIREKLSLPKGKKAG